MTKTFNDSAVDKLVKRSAERFGLGTTYLAQAFAALINELEAFRLEQLNKIAVNRETKMQLTAMERQQAEHFLQQPNLLKSTNELIGKTGVIGEENNRLLMYLVFTSRMENPAV